MNYTDISPLKKAFIFEFDNVLYPEREYFLQIYYLFANFVEYTHAQPAASDMIDFLKTDYDTNGHQDIFTRLSKRFTLSSELKNNLNNLERSATLPLKLELYPPLIALLQEIVVDRKLAFLITDGDTDTQLNKIRQTDWKGLQNYLKVYFTQEWAPKPETTVLNSIFDQYNILRKDVLIIGATKKDEEFAMAAGIDYLDQRLFL